MTIREIGMLTLMVYCYLSYIMTQINCFSLLEIMFRRYIACKYVAMDLFINFREATLPIEAEMNSNDINDDNGFNNQKTVKRTKFKFVLK